MKEKAVSEFAFLSKFNTEKKAVKFFEATRWPGGRYCPVCGNIDTCQHKSREFYYHCRACRKQFSCKTNTIMQASPIHVRTWLYAMYKISIAHKGISSMQLSKEIGVTQKTARHMLQCIKEACGNHGIKLDGVVEIDETCIGGKERDKRANAGRGTAGKKAVLEMRERGSRVKAKPIANTGMATMHREISGAFELGATACTDERSSYNRLNKGNRQNMLVRRIVALCTMCAGKTLAYKRLVRG